MSSQSDSSSGKRRRLSTSSPDKSTSSSDTGDVLIRSTRLKPGSGPGSESVRITVEKVRGRPAQPPVTEQQRLKPRQQPQMVFSQPGKISGRRSRFTQCCGYQAHYYWYFCVCACSDLRTQQKKPAPTRKNRVSPVPTSSDQVRDQAPQLACLCACARCII